MPAPARLVIHPIRDVTVVNFNETAILDTLQIEQIGEDLYDLVDRKACRKMILDFAKVQMLSSSALGVLITLKKKADKIKGKIVLCSLRKDLYKIFEVTRLNKLFEFQPSEAKALASFGVITGG